MKSKERVKRAFHFNKPDRVPLTTFALRCDFFVFPTTTPKSFQPKNYPPHIWGGATAYSSLLNLILGYKWKKRKNLNLPRKWWNHENELLTIDEWGVIWKSGPTSVDFSMGHPHQGPFHDSWEGVEDYNSPDASDKSRYRFWNSFLMRMLGKNRYLLGVPADVGIHNRVSFLRGMKTLMSDLRRNPSQVSTLVKTITEHFYIMIQQLKDHCPDLDCIGIYDDLGTQHAPFLSPTLFRKFFFNPYKKLIDLTHDLGMDFYLHSCGQVKELLPVFLDLGIDVMEFDSPNMTGVENFKGYAEQQKMAFFLSSDIQTTFSRGTPKEVEEEIKYYIKEVGNNQGGLAFYKYMDYKAIQAPKANARMFDKAIKKWGNYDQQGRIDWIHKEL